MLKPAAVSTSLLHISTTTKFLDRKCLPHWRNISKQLTTPQLRLPSIFGVGGGRTVTANNTQHFNLLVYTITSQQQEALKIGKGSKGHNSCMSR